MVVGHTRCGGAAASYDAVRANASLPDDALGQWLAPLVELERELPAPTNLSRWDGVRRLVEANVRMQVDLITQSNLIQHAWAQNRTVRVSGLLYELETGLLVDLGVVRDGQHADQACTAT
jgi:carbonic anhydrase